jgi:putative ABC transport system permease protein
MMLKPRWRKVLADLWENKSRTILVVLSIAIGVFAVGMIAGAYVIISQDLDLSYAAANPANIEIVTRPFDEEYVNAVARVSGVADVEARRDVSVRVQKPNGEWDILSLRVVPDFEDSKIDILLPMEGALVPAKKEAIFETKTLESLGAAVGDTLTIELADGSDLELKVAGVAMDRTLGYGAFMGDRTAYIQEESLDWLHEQVYYNKMYITVSDFPDDRTHLKSVGEAVEAYLNRSNYEVYRVELALTNEHPLSSIVEALIGILLILGVLVMFLSGSLITNTLSALMGQHLRQIGVMKLVGARRRQVISLYMLLILSFSLIALVLAVPAGSWAALATSRLAADVINAELRQHTIIPLAIILQIVIAIAVPQLAGISPVLRGASKTVQEAVSGSGQVQNTDKKGWIDRRLESIKGISRPLMVSLRNTFRQKGRLFLTLFNLMLGGAIFISVFNVQVSLNKKIEETTKYFKADVNLNFKIPYRITTVESLVGRVPGVAHVEGWAITGGELLKADDTVEDNITVFGPPIGTSLIEPILLEGRWLEAGDEHALAINEAIWRQHPELHVGDTMRLKINGRTRDWLIVGILQYTGMDDLFAYTHYPTLAREMNFTNEATSFRIVTTEHDTVFQEAVSRRVDEVFRTRDFLVSKVEAGNTLNESIFSYINILIVILLLLAILTALVGSIGLAGTLSMNVMERTREIGVMRAIGAYDKIVIRLVIIEGLLISMISFVLSVLLSFPITTLLANVVSMAIFNAPAQFAFTAQGFLIWLGLILVLSVVASIIPARSASRMTIREVLAYE